MLLFPFALATPIHLRPSRTAALVKFLHLVLQSTGLSMFVCSKEREDVEEIQLCGEFMRGLGRVSVVVKFNAHGFVIAMPVMMDGQKVA